MTEELISLDKICCIWYWLIYYVSNSRDGRGFDYINRYDPKANARWKKDNERKRTMLISSGVQFQRQSAACKHVGYWLWWHERLFVWGRCFPSQEQYRVCKQNPQMRLSELLALIMHQRLNHLAGKISKKIIRAVLTLHGSVLETRVFPLLFTDVWIIQIEFSLIRIYRRNVNGKRITQSCQWLADRIVFFNVSVFSCAKWSEVRQMGFWMEQRDNWLMRVLIYYLKRIYWEILFHWSTSSLTLKLKYRDGQNGNKKARMFKTSFCQNLNL